jgi:hypothetical protein
MKNIINEEDSNKNNSVIKSDIIIYKTMDYNKFKFSGLNRTPKHFKKIIESIKKGDFTAYNPIMVVVMENGDLLIIDGQNRYMACKTLGLPIHFVVSEEANIEDAPILNNASKNWAGREYVEHFAKMGHIDYIKVLEANKKYGAPLSSIVSVCSCQNLYNEHLKRGTYKISEKRNPNELCEHWKDVVKYIPFAKTDRFFTTLATCFYNENYDTNRMMEKLSKCSGIMFEQPNRPLITKEIEKVYNYHMKASNIVKFSK